MQANAATPLTNRLDKETSPYLRQHADNPVAWQPWGKEAIDLARSQDKPIFLSIGYSACHWCHVMEHESFESAEIAELLNRHFIPIKVDREERPDIDAIYMKAVMAMTGAGGWPLSVFLTPSLEPFFGGTYFPPNAQYGRPGFKDLLLHIVKIYEERRHNIKAEARAMAGRLAQMARPAKEPGELDPSLLDGAMRRLEKGFDARHGGFQGAPKFPSPTMLRFLLRYGASSRQESASARSQAILTLRRMARGGIYDQLGGGFHRYSTDDQWLVPHFEKMLYDNAQLARVYAEAWQLTRDDEFKKIAMDILDYLLREMRHESGLFASSQDADSEGVEGKFYVWKWHELEAALEPPQDLNDAAEFWGASQEGNWEYGLNILTASVKADEAKRERLRRILLKWRQTRKLPPERDDKVLADWNALAVSALAYAGAAFDEPRYIEAAQKTAKAADVKFFSADGSVAHCQGPRGPIGGLLEDYAYWVNALIDLYEATLELRQLEQARLLGGRMNELFWDPKTAAFLAFPQSGADPYLIHNTEETHDGVMPSGVSAAAEALLRVGRYFDDEEALRLSQAALKRHAKEMEESPFGMTHFLSVLAQSFDEPWRIEIAGSGAFDQGIKPLKAAIARRYWSSRVVSLGTKEFQKVFSWVKASIGAEGARPEVFLCQGRECLLPSSDPREIEEFLTGKMPLWK
ncbi:MAG: thioredoxin domain-containing protein [Elusimicrobia bacterium]|nr:thioredoxin domain-containing protein [Elusimicrobiota bacterium]